jgi:hypothetical protein
MGLSKAKMVQFELIAGRSFVAGYVFDSYLPVKKSFGIALAQTCGYNFCGTFLHASQPPMNSGLCGKGVSRLRTSKRARRPKPPRSLSLLVA